MMAFRQEERVYIPAHFAVNDQAVLHDLMRRFNFATLVTEQEGRLMATHLPLLLHSDQGEHGTLLGHVARANEQWQDFERGAEALVIFQGDHAYISPSWYETFPAVPTWNYMVVHAYGMPRVIEVEERVRAVLGELVAKHEAGFDEPWPMDLPEEYLRKMMRAIVAFELPIARLEGKFKLSQNQPERNLARVIAMLGASDDPAARELAARMRGLS
jgi:transcriptional regulator